MKWRFAFFLLLLLLLLPLSNVAAGQSLSNDTSTERTHLVQQLPRVDNSISAKYKLVGHISTPKSFDNDLPKATNSDYKSDISSSSLSGKVLWISIGSAVLVGGVTAAVLLAGGETTGTDGAPPPPDRPDN